MVKSTKQSLLAFVFYILRNGPFMSYREISIINLLNFNQSDGGF